MGGVEIYGKGSVSPTNISSELWTASVSNTVSNYTVPKDKVLVILGATATDGGQASLYEVGGTSTLVAIHTVTGTAGGFASNFNGEIWLDADSSFSMISNSGTETAYFWGTLYDRNYLGAFSGDIRGMRSLRPISPNGKRPGRLWNLRGTDAGVSYTVPDGKTLVICSLHSSVDGYGTLNSASGTAGATAVRVGGIDSASGTMYRFNGELVFKSGETITLDATTSDFCYAVGYLYDN